MTWYAPVPWPQKISTNQPAGQLTIQGTNQNNRPTNKPTNQPTIQPSIQPTPTNTNQHQPKPTKTNQNQPKPTKTNQPTNTNQQISGPAADHPTNHQPNNQPTSKKSQPPPSKILQTSWHMAMRDCITSFPNCRSQLLQLRKKRPQFLENVLENEAPWNFNKAGILQSDGHPATKSFGPIRTSRPALNIEGQGSPCTV